jgi:tetraacyldisaccharide 4'-kinase
VGNITTGGTGKTPAVEMLANWAAREGFTVAVLSRGYSGKYKKEVLEVSDRKKILSNPLEAGDEPFLLASNLPGIPVVISKKRYKAGLLANKKYGSNFYILDDGFQHLELERDMDLVLVDSQNPFGNGYLLPRGPLREPVSSLKRADAVVFTRAESVKPVMDTEWFFKEAFTTEKAYYGGHFPAEVNFPGKKVVLEPSFLEGRRIIAFAGIARPGEFMKTLKDLGADVLYFKSFRDHHQYTKTEIDSLIRKKEEKDAEHIFTTEKDWVRISSLSTDLSDIAHLNIKFEFISGKDEILTSIKNRANSKLGRGQ